MASASAEKRERAMENRLKNSKKRKDQKLALLSLYVCTRYENRGGGVGAKSVWFRYTN